MAEMETTWMKSPTGELQEVPVDGTMGEFNKKLNAGWKVCEDPAAVATPKDHSAAPAALATGTSNDEIKN